VRAGCSYAMHHAPLLLLLAFGPATALAQVSATIQHNGITRDHIVYVPSNYDPNSEVPLVFVLHGFTQSASAIMSATGFNDLAEQDGFIVAYPNGVNNGWNTNSPFPGGSTADDVGYIGALRDSLIAQFSIDTARTYACGFSAGGYMSFKLACESPKCFAAIASVAGTINTGAVAACAPQHTPGVLQIHGTSDLVVSYNGSIFSGLGVPAVLNLWTDLLDCVTPAVITPITSSVEQQVYAPCEGNATVMHYRISGGGHVWPIGSAFSATNTIWEFFQGFNCGDLTTGIPTTTTKTLHVWPNPVATTAWVDGPSDATPYALLDATGRTVRSGTLPMQQGMLDMQDLGAGTYILLLLDGSGRSVRIQKH
jgi:polyhydroxybutyrate depolymerase